MIPTSSAPSPRSRRPKFGRALTPMRSFGRSQAQNLCFCVAPTRKKTKLGDGRVTDPRDVPNPKPPDHAAAHDLREHFQAPADLLDLEGARVEVLSVHTFNRKRPAAVR